MALTELERNLLAEVEEIRRENQELRTTLTELLQKQNDSQRTLLSQLKQQSSALGALEKRLNEL